MWTGRDGSFRFKLYFWGIPGIMEMNEPDSACPQVTHQTVLMQVGIAYKGEESKNAEGCG